MGSTEPASGDSFPYLDQDTRFTFPSVESATEEGIVGVGGNLSPGMLLSAYSQGIFPWYSDGEPILWWSPDPRFVLLPADLHTPKSLRRILNKRPFEVTVDTAFSRVIQACAAIPRPWQSGTWITQEMIDGYTELHSIGYAHSVEVWEERQLIGGLYGVSLGSCFFGESMFSQVPDASKVGFVVFVHSATKAGINLIDSQVYTDHVARFGGKDISRTEYLALLDACLARPTIVGDWSEQLDISYP